jgi:hypothetical protein
VGRPSSCSLSGGRGRGAAWGAGPQASGWVRGGEARRAVRAGRGRAPVHGRGPLPGRGIWPRLRPPLGSRPPAAREGGSRGYQPPNRGPFPGRWHRQSSCRRLRMPSSARGADASGSGRPGDDWSRKRLAEPLRLGPKSSCHPRGAPRGRDRGRMRDKGGLPPAPLPLKRPIRASERHRPFSPAHRCRYRDQIGRFVGNCLARPRRVSRR